MMIVSVVSVWFVAVVWIVDGCLNLVMGNSHFLSLGSVQSMFFQHQYRIVPLLLLMWKMKHCYTLPFYLSDPETALHDKCLT